MQIELNNITINYVKGGKGMPLILLHGNGEDHTIFNPLIEVLKEHFTVYAVDSRNHGGSSKTDDFTYETMMEDIYQFTQKLGLKNASVVGFSDGAIIALLLELAYSNTFEKMVLLGINLHPSDFKEENIEYLKTEYKKTKDPLFKMMLEEPNIDLDRLKTVLTDTLIVRAEDELFHDSLYENMVNAMPHARLLVMKGHDHGSYIVNTDVLYDDLIGFL